MTFIKSLYFVVVKYLLNVFIYPKITAVTVQIVYFICEMNIYLTFNENFL